MVVFRRRHSARLVTVPCHRVERIRRITIQFDNDAHARWKSIFRKSGWITIDPHAARPERSGPTWWHSSQQRDGFTTARGIGSSSTSSAHDQFTVVQALFRGCSGEAVRVGSPETMRPGGTGQPLLVGW